MTYTLALDIGESSGLALCRAVPGRLPECVGVWSVYGERHLWVPRMRAALVGARDRCLVAERSPPRTWIEVPQPTVRAGGMAHHRTGNGLGIRIGIAIGLAYEVMGALPTEVTPAEWWKPWRGLLAIKGKTRKTCSTRAGWERVGQAGIVPGAAGLLAGIGEAHRVDVSEAVLIAGAMALAGVTA